MTKITIWYAIKYCSGTPLLKWFMDRESAEALAYAAEEGWKPQVGSVETFKGSDIHKKAYMAKLNAFREGSFRGFESLKRNILAVDAGTATISGSDLFKKFVSDLMKMKQEDPERFEFLKSSVMSVARDGDYDWA